MDYVNKFCRKIQTYIKIFTLNIQNNHVNKEITHAKKRNNLELHKIYICFWIYLFDKYKHLKFIILEVHSEYVRLKWITRLNYLRNLIYVNRLPWMNRINLFLLLLSFNLSFTFNFIYLKKRRKKINKIIYKKAEN